MALEESPIDHMLGPSFVSGGQQVFEFLKMMAHHEVYLRCAQLANASRVLGNLNDELHLITRGQDTTRTTKTTRKAGRRCRPGLSSRVGSLGVPSRRSAGGRRTPNRRFFRPPSPPFQPRDFRLPPRELLARELAPDTVVAARPTGGHFGSQIRESVQERQHVLLLHGEMKVGLRCSLSVTALERNVGESDGGSVRKRALQRSVLCQEGNGGESALVVVSSVFFSGGRGGRGASQLWSWVCSSSVFVLRRAGGPVSFRGCDASSVFVLRRAGGPVSFRGCDVRRLFLF